MLISILFFVTLSFSAFTQPCIISGTITDQETNEAIPFVYVVLMQEGMDVISATTDFDGKYSIIGLAKGTYDIKATYVGFEPFFSKGIILKPDSALTFNISMKSTMVTLEAVECIGYISPKISKSHAYAAASVGDIAGVRVMGVSSYKSPVSRKKITDVVEFNRDVNDGNLELKPGQLTASELNDFSKWELWQDIGKKDLAFHGKFWGIAATNRYSVQVKTKDNSPVVDATVLLKDGSGSVIWISRTDNTGKAELWSGLFGEKQKAKSLSVIASGEEFNYGRPNAFGQGINVLIIPHQCAQPTNTEIAFVVDATGSMEDEMNYLKAELLDIIKSVDNSNSSYSTMLASVFYRDHGDEYITRFNDFTTDFEVIQEFTKAQNADNGGDVEEAFDEAYDLAVNQLKWSKEARARIIFVLLDAAPHADSINLALLKKTTRDAAQKGIRTIPIVASGAGPQAPSLEYLMRSIALATNGTYVFLTDHSKIGDAHATPVTDSYDVEYLNELIKRLINQYSYMPSCENLPDSLSRPDTTLITTKRIIKHEVVDSTRAIASITPDPIIIDFTKGQPKDSTLVLSDSTLVLNDSTKNAAVNNSSESTETKEIKFYPNPTTGELTILVNGDIKELFLLDISGKLLEVINCRSGKMSINISKYSNGIYFLKFKENGQWFSGKVVLRK